MGFEFVYWKKLSQDRIHKGAPLNTFLNIWLVHRTKGFLTISGFEVESYCFAFFVDCVAIKIQLDTGYVHLAIFFFFVYLPCLRHVFVHNEPL
jgi:hypothetical protein